MRLSKEEMLEEVNFFARPLPRWHVLFVAQDHTTHHCGQAVLYLNARGITPHITGNGNPVFASLTLIYNHFMAIINQISDYKYEICNS
jgi:uncharacterized damage-inducible protein DinB